MDHLSAAQVEELRSLLEHERSTVRERFEQLDEQTKGLVQDPGDQQDHATVETQIRELRDLSERDLLRLKELDDALARMADGTYGLCDDTGEPIPFGRLKLQPTTRYTVEAQEAIEAERAENPEGDLAY